MPAALPSRRSVSLGARSRDHRTARAWLSMDRSALLRRAKKIEPWSDTRVEIQGQAVAEIERAFAYIRAKKEAATDRNWNHRQNSSRRVKTSVPVVATAPMTAGMSRR